MIRYLGLFTNIYLLASELTLSSVFLPWGRLLFKARKDFKRIQNGVSPFTVAEFCAWWIVYNSCYLRGRSHFVNSAFPNKLIYDKQIWKQMFAKILRFKWTRERVLQEDDILPWATEPPFLSALHAKNDTTNPFGYKLGESTENNRALLFFSGKEIIQTFKTSI